MSIRDCPVITIDGTHASSDAFFVRLSGDLQVLLVETLGDHFLGKTGHDRSVELCRPGKDRIDHSNRVQCLATVCDSLVERSEVSQCDIQIYTGDSFSFG
ncbi:MAG: hypothetical protein M3R63_20500 [Actinomycetota bacterium]|nr:hypothetical protein [Actinomycetota bacterium]